MPKVTVLMPVHNAALFVGCAIESILSQSFRDFEFLIIDDGSTDGSQSTIRSYADSRIRFVQNEENLGVAETLNRGLEMAHGEYVARMDADDISMRRRLEHQVRFMDAHPDVGVSGSWARLVGKYQGAVLRRPCGALCVCAALCLDNPLCHPSAVIRRSILDFHRLRYNPTYGRTEDFDLWSRIAEFVAIDNIPLVLLQFRVHQKSVTASAYEEMETQTLEILRRELRKLGIDPSDAELRFHRDIGHGNRLTSREALVQAEGWLHRLIKANNESGYHDARGMDAAVSFAWFRLCANNCNLGPWVWRRYRKSSLATAGYTPSIEEKLCFFAGIARSVCRKP